MSLELYYKNKDNQLEQTDLISIIANALREAKMNIERDSFNDGSGKWINIIQESKRSTEVMVTLSFDSEGQEITSVAVYETPIKRVVDNDEQKKLV